MKEIYVVKFWYQKEDGYWAPKEKEEEEVNIPMENGLEDTEKDNHQHASQIIEDKYPTCRITSVIYV